VRLNAPKVANCETEKRPGPVEDAPLTASVALVETVGAQGGAKPLRI
jgi:hypothetical protein